MIFLVLLDSCPTENGDSILFHFNFFLHFVTSNSQILCNDCIEIRKDIKAHAHSHPHAVEAVAADIGI